jgi:hypothetical protein
MPASFAWGDVDVDGGGGGGHCIANYVQCRRVQCSTVQCSAQRLLASLNCTLFTSGTVQEIAMQSSSVECRNSAEP